MANISIPLTGDIIHITSDERSLNWMYKDGAEKVAKNIQIISEESIPSLKESGMHFPSRQLHEGDVLIRHPYEPNMYIDAQNAAFEIRFSKYTLISEIAQRLGATHYQIEEAIETIEERAFAGCSSLTSIEIPANVTNIGLRAFVGCDLLSSVSVSEDNTNYISVDGILYTKDMKKILCFPAGKGDSSYIVSDGVEVIADGAFDGCENLVSISLPESVTRIGFYAFLNCESLTSINFSGTVEEWNAINKYDNWNYSVPATKVVCSDGDVAL